MILPRLALFETNGRVLPMTHLVIVDDTVYKAVCVRQLIRNGALIDPSSTITCRSCSHRGWIYTMGNISSKPVPTDHDGRWVSRV